MPKTATKTKKTERVETTVNAPTVNAVLDDFNTNGKQPETVGEMIAITSLEPSPTNPRKRFPDESIAELAGSIKEQGVIEPLVVRLNYQSTEDDRRAPFEIVCGERRYRASLVAGLDKLPCIVRDLTDDQVLDIQIHENLHREDVHPMDEAYGYQFLQEKLGCNIAELSLRVGKNEAFVLGRLKLNQLIDEIKTDVENDLLPLGYAMTIAKFPPETQVRIHEKCFDTNYDYRTEKHVIDKTRVKPWNSVNQFIQNNVLYQLTQAPFDKKAIDLHPEALACVKCPDRTGANRTLFPTDEVGKKDQCLRPVCYAAKTQAMVDNAKRRVAEESNIAFEDVPTYSGNSYHGQNGTLGTGDAQIVGERAKGKDAKGVFQAVSIGGDTFGQIVLLKKHSRGSDSSSGSSTVKSEADREKELDAKRQRREELFDCRVSNIVRQRVFRFAADEFARSATLDETGIDFLPRLVAKIWVNSNNGDGAHTRGMVERMMEEITDSRVSLQHWSLDTATKQAAEMSETNLRLMLFCLVHGEKGHTYYDRWESQAEVKALAEEYGFDYRLADAQVRLEVAEEKAKKHVDEFKRYLNIVEAGGQNALIPRVWSENWKPKD